MLGIEPRSLYILGKSSTTATPPRNVPFQITSHCAARKDFRLIVEFRVAQTNGAPSASSLRALDCTCKPPCLGFILLETVCLFSPDELKVRILLPLPLDYWDYMSY